jgi:hypothetical protein
MARTRSAPGSQKLLADKIIDQLGEVGVDPLDRNIVFATDRNSNLTSVTGTVKKFPGSRAHTLKRVIASVRKTQKNDGVSASLTEDLGMWT